MLPTDILVKIRTDLIISHSNNKNGFNYGYRHDKYGKYHSKMIHDFHSLIEYHIPKNGNPFIMLFYGWLEDNIQDRVTEENPKQILEFFKKFIIEEYNIKDELKGWELTYSPDENQKINLANVFF